MLPDHGAIAAVEHWFHHIEADLTALVFFAPAEGTHATPAD